MLYHSSMTPHKETPVPSVTGRCVSGLLLQLVEGVFLPAPPPHKTVSAQPTKSHDTVDSRWTPSGLPFEPPLSSIKERSCPSSSGLVRVHHETTRF